MLDNFLTFLIRLAYWNGGLLATLGTDLRVETDANVVQIERPTWIL